MCWANFASEIFRQASRSVTIVPTTTAEYTTSTRRPLNSRMNCSKTNSIFGIEQLDWRLGLKVILKELKVTV